MMLNIGNLGKMFGMLPSQVAQQATTYDLMIADVLSSWENYQIQKATGKIAPPDLTQSEMLEMLRKARNEPSQ